MFGISSHRAQLYAPAAKSAVVEEAKKLLAILGEPDPSVAEELARETVSQGILTQMATWNAKLGSINQPDQIGKAALQFWAAQTLATTVMSPRALDPDTSYSPALRTAMERGADGLVEVGRPQFEALCRLGSNLLSWIVDQGFKSFSIIESPLGNSLPVQIVCDLAREREVKATAIEWNAPRNDRPRRGRTIAEASSQCAQAAKEADLVVFLDDVLTGTRFIKLLDGLIGEFATRPFLPIAMLFKDASQSSNANIGNLKRLVERLQGQSKRIKYPDPIIEFPAQEPFSVDSSGLVRWESPIMWGDSDLIAGKRKVNLIFTLLDHCLGILEDLAAPESEFRAYLDSAWQQDESGARYITAPGLVQSVFHNIVVELRLEELHSVLWSEAKKRFPEDYVGQPFAYHERGTKERWDWFRENFLSEAGKRVDEQRAGLAWRAIEDTFSVSIFDKRPRPRRDLDAAAYTFQFNPTIAALNLQLRKKILALK